jgi:citronellol/citronellal dehydrogenase
MAGELTDDKVGCNTLWPRTSIATAAIKYLLGGDPAIRASRTPEIMADAAYTILTSKSASTNGNFFIVNLIKLICL